MYDGESNKDKPLEDPNLSGYIGLANIPDGGFQRGEGPSFTCLACAEGLAKYAAFMANKGTF